MSETPEEAHSSLVGGSTADRRINCPGSYQMEAKLPATVKNESSSYADEGTSLHAALQHILVNNITDLDEVRGMEFEGYVMTTELMEQAVIPCVDFFDALCDESIEEGELDFMVEQRCQMPGIPDAFGTSDLIGRTNKRSVIVDWKFGVGVPVKAAYEDDDGVMRPNAQLMFYARAAMHSFPDMFDRSNPDWPVDLYIVQPRGRDSNGEPSHHQVTVKQLDEFRDQLVRAVSEATGKNPTTKRGDWCRFAKCKTICPHFTTPAVDLTKMHGALEKKKTGVLAGVDIDWSVVYGELLTLADLAELIIGEVRAQAHAFLEEGNQIVDVEGNQLYKLVPKRASEKYTDERAAYDLALAHGVDPQNAMTAPMVKSPAQLREALAAALTEDEYGKTKKAKLDAAKSLIGQYTANVSSGTTLAPASDRRPEAIQTAKTISSLSTKLAALTGR